MTASRRLAPLLPLLAGLAALAVLVLIPWVVQAQSRDSGSDFTLDAANGYPTGIWSDGTTLWVADFEDRKLYAYRMPDRSRDSGRDLTLDTANGSPVGIWSDGTTMWASDFTDGKLYAYRMSDRSRDPGKDFNTLSAAGNNFPEGIWSDGTTMWVADTGNDTVFAYDLSTRAWDFEKDITLGPGHDSPMGVWSNGSTMWVSDWRDSKLYAYRMSDQTRDSGKDFALDADDESYEGIWSAGATMWVASRDDVKLYAYDWNNPATGAPTITGAVRVNETLAAGARSIADADGLDAASFEYQWVSNDGNADTDIAGATDSTYTIVPGDRGRTVRVRVSFTDGAGNRESLTSGPTGRIGAPGICDRTPAVMAAIVAGMTGAGDCSEVSETRLRAWTGSHRFGSGVTPGLHLRGRGLPALQAGDFRGLHALRALDLNRNFLETVPDGLFEDLRTVEEVHLSGNLLNELPEGTFDGQTANLSVLDLSANGLETLPEGALRNLAGLVSLSLAGNGLSHLPAGLFDDLARLEVLDLSANSIDELPDGLFDGNLELRGLDLSKNEISELPEGVFAGLGNLAELDLSGNELEDLPAGVFEGLPGLTDLDAGDNPGAPFTFTAELERRGDDTVVVRIAEGATPFGMTIELSALKGELSAETVTIAAGGSYSDVVEVRARREHHPVTVEIDSAAFLAPAGGSTPGIRAGRGSDMHLWIGRPLVQREWIQDEDFALHPENASPKSIWSDGETLWVGDDTAAKVFAYKLWDDPATEASEYGARDPGMDVPALGQEDFYVTGHGSRLYVAEESLDGASRDVFGYDLTDLTRAEDRDFVYGGLNVAGGVMIVRGMATDGRHLWITNTTSHAHAFRLFDDPETPEDEYGRPDASRKLTIPGRGQLKGLFTDGRTMWGVRFASNDASARSVKLSDGTEAGYDFPLHEDNDHAYGIWSDGETFYVVDADDAMIYTYHGVGGVVRPFVAGAETAAALVGNTGQSGDAGHDLGSAGAKRAQAFTTGTSRAGYALASVGIGFGEVSDPSSAPSDLEVTLNADGGGVPGGALCTLIAPASLSERSVNTLAAPASGTTCPALVKETTYFVVVERVRVTGSGAIAVSGTASGSEDTGAAEGWSIADGSAAYSPQAAAQGWASDAFSYRIEARGSFINNPAAGEATVTGTPRVKGTLAAAVSDVSDDDGLTRAAYSYQWMRVDGATETNIGTGSSTYTLAAEDLGKRIRVRVAFVDDRGNYETLTSEATEAIKAADRPGSVSLFPARPRAGTVVSAALSDPDGLGGGGSGPAASSGAVSWSWARSSDGTAWTGVEAYDDGDSYVPTEEDEGMLLRAEASYTDGQGPGKSAEAVSPAVVGAREPGPELTVTEIVTGLSHPWGIDFTPDGTMLFTQRAGVLNARLTDGAVRRVAADLGDLLVDGFAGLQALAVDPDFATNRRFYTLQGHTGREMRVIAWTIDADYDEATRVVDPLVKGMPIGPGPWHSGGRLLFGPEGYLWIATGDGRVVTGAQDLTSLGGKVLRVDPRTGAGAPGNPFGASSPVYAYGFRNPQGLALRPGTDQMWLVEHGPKHDDEINLLAPGGNYGWDPIPDDGALVFYDYSDEAGVPMTDLAKFPSARQARWSSGFPTLATSGAVFLDGPQWGEWEGRLAVATLKTKSLRVFEFTEQGDFAGQIVVPELDGSQGRLRTPALGPDGALYIATSNRPGNDRILRVSANRAATGSPVISGVFEVGESLTAVVSGIADPDGLDDDAFRFQWVRSHFGSNSSDIEGATASTYTLVMADFGKTISVRVSFHDDRGSLEALTSRRTVKVSVVACTVGEHAPAPTAVEVQAIPAIVESTTGEYFALYVRPALDSDREFPVSVTLGEDGATTLTEQLSPLPKEHYRVEKFLIADPADLDDDCIDDITELGDPVGMNPLNPARAVPFRDGAVAIPGRETFEALSYKGRDVPNHPRLRDLEFVKFYIIGVATDNMGIYFMNTETHRLHPDFGDAIGLWEDPLWGQGYMGGEIIYHPNVVAPDGSLGVYLYQFQPMDAYTFGHVARSYEVLAASMPLLDDNLAYYPMPRRALPLYHRERALYDGSRINVVLREDIRQDVPFLPLNVGEGYGFLRLMSLEERPDPRDVAIYETIPNELSRVAGLITTVPQTPLSHVNLRAVQDGVPNAFIRDALDDGDIDDLIGRYVHYSVTADGYSIRAATPAEVEAHFAASRPPGTQTPERDLTVTRITGLDDIGFDDWNAFGVKAANVAVLRTLGFPDGTVPDGFAAPFYFYDEFMKHNGFYDDIEEMLEDPDFQSDYDTQEKELKKLRKKIKKGDTPEWIIAALTEMHSKYPEGQSLRYRSSTNNEDLPGFSGAGLYDSKTQHPDETEEDGIAKSLKQVYASLWNFRAFTEREFYRVDHLAAAMGVLVHPNYSDELANGVAVSFDPIRMRYGNYYVNSQLGEDLVTNPDAHSAPEEILLHQGGEYTVLATSNQMQRGQLLMSDAQMDQLRRHLELIHDEFAKLYGVEGDEPFAMEIEFKITSGDVLSIKQARPWVFGDDAPSENNPATGAPTISGTVQVNETLTADISGIADADGLTSLLYGSLYSYQWIRNDGTTETDIEDAASSTYTLSEADVGKTIRVRVSFTDDRGYEETLTSAATTAVTRPNSPATGAPTISGTAQVDETLTADISGIADADGLTSVSYSYQWIANDASADTDISGQTGSTYSLVSADVGKTIRVRVSFTDDRGHEENLVSAATTVVQPRPNSPATGAPTISGTAQVAETLTADVSGIADADGLTSVSYSYQWIANDGNTGTDISGQTGSTYTLVSADVGKTIEVRVSFTDDRGNEETLTGAATTAVQPRPNSPATGAPTISGTAQVGETLTADVSGIADADGLTSVSYSYQWIANDASADTDISGQTGSTYTLVSADVGKTIRVRVGFDDDANNSETLTSEATATVPTADEWWADMLVVDYGTGAIGAASADLFSNSGGNAGLQAKWLWYYSPERKLRLAFTENIPGVDDLTLQVGDVALALQPGDATYSWEDVDVDWEDGQTLTARIVHARASTVVVPNSPATGAPIIGGTAQAGETLTALTNGITDADGLTSPTYSYQWLAANVGVAGATNSTYTLTDADAGKTIKVRVSFTDDADHEETLTSAATGVVAAKPNSPATGAPAIDGTAQVGETLTVLTNGITDADGLTNVSYSYQWIRNDGNTDSDIESATSTTYNLVTADQGKTIKVRVSFTDRGGYQETLTSTATTAVAARTSSDIIIVDVPGTVSLWPELPRVGTVVRATLTDPDGLEGAGSGAAASLGAVSWQWARSSEGSAWTSVDVYADGDSYTPTEDDEGMWLEVTAVYTDGHGQGKSAEAITAATVGAREASPELTVTALVTGLTHPWDIAFTPDGTMLFTERDHGLRVRLTDGTVRQVTADFSDLNFGGTAGLLALVLDPDFVSNRRFYTYQRHTGAEMQLIAWTIDEDYTSATRVADPLVGGIPVNLRHLGPSHGGGRLRFGPQGYLWVATGDGYSGTAAQDLSSLGGKVLRVDSQTGAGAPDNPFAPSPVYTYGHRNPQGLALRPGAGQMWSVEHGPDHDDEINLLVSGGNYGWDPAPDEGAEDLYDETTTPMTDLVKFPDALQAKWSSGHPTLAVGGGVFLEGSQWREWEGQFAVATLKTRSVRVFKFTEEGDLVSQVVVPELDRTYGRLRTAVLGPDGALYITTTNGGGKDKILKVVPANTPATGAPSISGTAQVDETQTADTSGIADADGLDNVSYTYQWIRNDGNTDTDIQNATSTTYMVSDDDAGKTIRVRVSFTDDADHEETLTSAATGVVAAKPNSPATGAPTIDGTAQVGETLTVLTNGITDADGLTNVSYSYQWLAANVEIAGATNSTYTLTDEDVGKGIKVRVSFTDDADNQESLTSEATDTVAATKPGVPGRLNVFPHDAGALDVYWEAPASDGGSAITGYKVRWKESADSWDTPADVSEATASGTIHTITGLTGGVEYSVRVLATNGVGDSPPSVEQTGTPRETRAPEMVRPRVDGATLKVLYDEALDEGSAPPADSFDVRVACTCDDTTWLDEEAKRAVESVSVDGDTVVLTLVSAATSEDVVVVSYTPPSDAATARTRDLAGNAAAGFNATEVFNDTDETAESEKSGEPEETTEGETPLTVGLEAATESHNGTDAFTFEIRFSEELPLSYKTLRDLAFTVSGGEVLKAQRLDKPSNIRWLITVEPDSNGDVAIVLPETTDCDADGAVCTADGRKLSKRLEFTVSGPGQ